MSATWAPVRDLGDHEALTELGISWKLGIGVASVDANGVTLENGERIEADTVVWTAGARANA